MSDSERLAGTEQSDSLHRVELTFDDGVYIKLICPPEGCEPGTTCASCGREVRGPSSDGCYDCKDGYGDQCWVKGWVENMTAEELLHGKLTVAISPSFDGDVTVLEIIGPESRETA